MSIVMCILCLNIGVALGMLLSGILREQREALAAHEAANRCDLPVNAYQGARPAGPVTAVSPLPTTTGATVPLT